MSPPAPLRARTAEAQLAFDCFGGRCEIRVTGDTAERSAGEAVELGRDLLLRWDARFSRFRADSELSRLNVDPRERVPVTPLMARLAGAAVLAGERTHGLVDATLIGAIERAGYTATLGEAPALAEVLSEVRTRRPAAAARDGGWRAIEVELDPPAVVRPAGVMLDSGGLAKGLFADALASLFAVHEGFAVDCAGDLTIGGSASRVRPIRVESPFDGRCLHTFRRRTGGVATSGIGRRGWRTKSGAPAHHLLDPATGEPAFTGIVQATALAPTALEAEMRAKAALLGGPGASAKWLSHGGLLVYDDGRHQVLEPPAPRRSGSAAPARGREGAHPRSRPSVTLRQR
ncbi:MAG TPA: FAD:protein FMN transferase [Solirubrobacteraceae bacterium]|jgi:thiamine biosynthesis lipoprotein|nr:FAD:protein FMN transferase [Solirubrobacteraceae bacterium]